MTGALTRQKVVVVKVLIGGATGMIGTAVTAALRERGDTVYTLVRRAVRGPQEVRWHPEHGDLDPRDVAQFDAVIGLAGEPVARLPWPPRWPTSTNSADGFGVIDADDGGLNLTRLGFDGWRRRCVRRSME